MLPAKLFEYSPSIGHKLHKDQNMPIRPILGEYSTSLDSNITNGSILVEYTIRPCDPASEAPCRQELVPFRGERSSTLGCLQRHASRARVAMTNQVLSHACEAFNIDTACARLGPCGWRCVGRPTRTMTTLRRRDDFIAKNGYGHTHRYVPNPAPLPSPLTYDGRLGP